MACGKPVLAYRKGGLTETLIEGVTGQFFDEQTVESMEGGLTQLLINEKDYSAKDISAIRETGGVWEIQGVSFYFPEHFGFCYGVDKAIDMVFETCARFAADGNERKRIFLTDQLIHNPYINGKLKQKGVCYLRRDSHNLLICNEFNS